MQNNRIPGRNKITANIIALAIILTAFNMVAKAQCLSGNCINGKGKFDYGWCVYEGEFKEGKANGTGSMKYSDYTYKGGFKNGVEDGAGEITYADGRKESVTYHEGRKAAGPIKVAAGDYKPLEGYDPGCVSGNCENGYGTYHFNSGNKYSGNFKNRKREGNGTAYFADGDKFVGTWHDNEKVKGTYTFSNGSVYTGTYDTLGFEQNGKLVANGTEVSFNNGKAKVTVQPPRISYTYSKSDQQSGQEKKQYKPACPDCHGMGKTHETYVGGATAVDKYGNRSTVFGSYTRCLRCKGTGYTE